MNDELKRNLGRQPLADILDAHRLKPHDLVAKSDEFLTHKMVSRAIKGRRLTLNAQSKVLNALSKAAGKRYTLDELFNYKDLSADP